MESDEPQSFGENPALNIGNPSVLGENLGGSHAETRRSQRDVDWELVDIENRLRLKKERANAKRALTKLLNDISSVLVEDRSVALTSLKDCEENLCAVFEVFRRACYSYKDVLHDEADLEACAVYFSELETKWLSIRERVKLRLELDERIPPDKSNLPSITPEDPISQFASNSSLSSNVSKSSRASSYTCKAILNEKRLENATRRASLVAEESLLGRKQSLAYQELKLNQLKEELQLHTEITKLEAEEKACNELSSSCVQTGNLKTNKVQNFSWLERSRSSPPCLGPRHHPSPYTTPKPPSYPRPKASSPCLPPFSKQFPLPKKKTRTIHRRTECLPIQPEQICIQTDCFTSRTDCLPSRKNCFHIRTDCFPSRTECLPIQPEQICIRTDQFHIRTDCFPSPTECLPIQPEQICIRTDQFHIWTDCFPSRKECLLIWSEQISIRTDCFPIQPKQICIRIDCFHSQTECFLIWPDQFHIRTN